MTNRPYQRQNKTSEMMILGEPPTWRIEMELADTPNVSAQRERLTIVTQVSAPLPDHPQGLELAALRRVRDLLTAQIEAMQSP
jgi:hypothetical protein